MLKASFHHTILPGYTFQTGGKLIAIDQSIWAIFRKRDRFIWKWLDGSQWELQRRTRGPVVSGKYTIIRDDIEVATIELTTDPRRGRSLYRFSGWHDESPVRIEIVYHKRGLSLRIDGRTCAVCRLVDIYATVRAKSTVDPRCLNLLIGYFLINRIGGGITTHP